MNEGGDGLYKIGPDEMLAKRPSVMAGPTRLKRRSLQANQSRLDIDYQNCWVHVTPSDSITHSCQSSFMSVFQKVLIAIFSI